MYILKSTIYSEKKYMSDKIRKYRDAKFAYRYAFKRWIV